MDGVDDQRPSSSLNAFDFTFQDLLEKAEIPLANLRLLRHSERRAKPGHSPYELWRDHRSLFDRYQSEHSRNAHSKLRNAAYWAAFVATPSNETMFVGVYGSSFTGVSTESMDSVTTGNPVGAGEMYLYNVHLRQELFDYSGRLFIEWGEAQRAWVQKASQTKRVIELRKVFTDPPFPGFGELILPLSSVPGMPAAWKAVLKSARGIYVLSCPRTRELYVGSAYGEDGFLGRWMTYAINHHGGNIQLRSREPSDYRVAILEVVGERATDADIICLEGRWKEKLQTRQMGLNSN